MVASCFWVFPHALMILLAALSTADARLYEAAEALLELAPASVRWTLSVEGDTFQSKPVGTIALLSAAVPQEPPDPPLPLLHLTINTSATAQTMDGFGGCFNEKGWDALSALNATARADVMRAMFGKEGLRWGINRMPIGSSDFADGYYSLDDFPNDFTMAKLNLARDHTKLIPFIKAAMAINPQLRVWGSPWSAPEWLKDSAPQTPNNEGCVGRGSLNQDQKYQAAYALYLARAAQAYRSAGLNFEHLAIQNEPNNGGAGFSCDSFPHMHWTGEQLRTFLRDHLGPTFVAENLTDTVGIFLATFPLDNYTGYVAPALTDTEALKHLSGVGLQYGGLGMIAEIRADAAREKGPDLKLWETETPCGGGRFKSCGNGPGTHNNSWSWGEEQWQYMRSYIESGVSLYSQWNMVLDETGESGWNWSQCSPVTVFTRTQTVSFEGSYWATKHYSYFVEPGAKVLLVGGDNGPCRKVHNACGCARGCGTSPNQTSSRNDQFIAFQNPDGGLVLVGQNGGDSPRPVTVAIDGKAVLSEALPAHSFSTFVIQ